MPFNFMKRHFTLKEANDILPEVKEKLMKIMKVFIKLEFMRRVNIINEDPFLDQEQVVKESMNYYKLQYILFKELNDLTDIGVFVKDPTGGLIDFYSEHEGREIFLCYKYPEKKIEFWHEIEEGYTARKSVGLLKQNI